MGRVLIFAGVVLVVAGVAVILFGKMGAPLGRLPGDLRWSGRGWSVSFPIVTCLVLSVVLTLVLWVIGRFR